MRIWMVVRLSLSRLIVVLELTSLLFFWAQILWNAWRRRVRRFFLHCVPSLIFSTDYDLARQTTSFEPASLQNCEMFPPSRQC